MSWNDGETKPAQVSIFKCENGFGLEFISKSIDDTDELYTRKNYIAPSLSEAFLLAESYFKGELNA